MAVNDRRRPAAAAAILSLVVSAASAEDVLRLPIGDPARRDRDAPVVLDAITDTATGTLAAPSDLPGRLAGVRLLLVGEEHTDMDTHAIERRVLEELDRSGRRVLVGLEMYPYPAQAALDDWIAGRLSEPDFLEASRWYKNWGYNWAYYRDVFLFARERKLRMVAVNAPREVVSAVRKKGFQNLTAEEAEHIPARVDATNAEHMRLFRASFEDATFHAGMNDEQWQAMLNAQCTWDATMAYQAVSALTKEPDPRSILVVLVGAGHVQYGLGIERQARQWFTGRIASLIPVRVEDEQKRPVRSVKASYADFVWGIPPEAEPLYPDLGIATRPVEGGGLEVIHVEKDSLAARADLREKDLLVSLNGTALPDREALSRAMGQKRWGDTVTLVVRRDKEPATVTIPLRRRGPKTDG